LNVDAGNLELWATNPHNEVYHREGITSANFVGTRWA
jgi:hypothetical protein